MRSNSKNKKIVGTMVLFFLLCVALMAKDVKWKHADGEGVPAATATPTPEVPLVLSNVWLTKNEEQYIEVLHDGELHRYRLPSALGTPLSNCIVDVTVEEGYVTALTVQQDRIEAKVLRVNEEFVELEGYGKIALEEGSRVYRVYEEIEEKQWQDVLVGYTTASFVLSGECICAALIEKPVEVTSIRVVLQSSSYGGYYHDTLECGSSSGFYISDGSEKTTWMEGGATCTVTPELVEEYGGRIYVGTEGDKGTLSLYNVRRAVGVPSYRGTLEIALCEGKLLVVNELSLEEYLYGVLPSEMPESFGTEALKAQAICARSYACNQLMANRYREYGAHVDDSMNCQVYQNYGEVEAATEAVKATFGKILSREGECITAYYFSCSYGHTADSLDIWGENTGTLLEGGVQVDNKDTGNLSKTEQFENFLNSDRQWYDEESVWFRWSTVLGTELNDRILARLKERQKIVPESILIQTSNSGEELYFEQGEVEAFGVLKDILVAERGDSGVITKLILVGSEATYLIKKEYNVRYILAPMNVVYLKDGTTSGNMNLLPSAYFTLEKGDNYFLVQGGGHGHGAGMSQYGAKYLAKQGLSYEEILKHYYKEVDITYLYQ